MSEIRVRLLREDGPPGPWCEWVGSSADGHFIQVVVPQDDGTLRLRLWPLVGNRIEVENGTVIEVHP